MAGGTRLPGHAGSGVLVGAGRARCVPGPGLRGGLTMDWLGAVQQLRHDGQPGVLVTVVEVRGHAPREAGAKMVVGRDHTWGSVGGGNLEAAAIVRARELIESAATEPEISET